MTPPRTEAMEKSERPWAYWREVSKCDRVAITFAAPHYSIGKPLSQELGPPGCKIVLFGEDGRALWGSHRPDRQRERKEGRVPAGWRKMTALTTCRIITS